MTDMSNEAKSRILAQHAYQIRRYVETDGEKSIIAGGMARGLEMTMTYLGIEFERMESQLVRRLEND